MTGAGKEHLTSQVIVEQTNRTPNIPKHANTKEYHCTDESKCFP